MPVHDILTDIYDPSKVVQYSQWVDTRIGGLLVSQSRLVLKCGAITLETVNLVQLTGLPEVSDEHK